MIVVHREADSMPNLNIDIQKVCLSLSQGLKYLKDFLNVGCNYLQEDKK
jgi:hypothetical protein